MRSGFIVTGCLIALLGLAGGGCGRKAPLENREWTPEAIAQDPEGYLAFAEQQIQTQIAERQKKLQDLAGRKTEIVSRSAELTAKVKDADNVRRRLDAAVRKAEDENRWPVKIAGRTFNRDEAQAMLTGLHQYVEERRPLASAYEATVERIHATENALKKDLENLIRLREKTNLDAERLRLNRGLAEVSELNKTHTELTGFSDVLVNMSEDITAGLPPVTEKSRTTVDVESLLTKPKAK